MKAPRTVSALPPCLYPIKASPKAISGRTSYLRVRLEFLPFPTFFNRYGCGPPRSFTHASPCSWIDHTVSGLQLLTARPLKTRFRFESVAELLILASNRNSLARSTKSTPSSFSRSSTACKHMVSGSFSLPSRGPFHLSLTVLSSIGH